MIVYSCKHLFNPDGRVIINYLIIVVYVYYEVMWLYGKQDINYLSPTNFIQTARKVYQILYSTHGLYSYMR